MSDFGKLPSTEQAWTTVGDVVRWERDARGVMLDCGGPRVRVSLITPAMLRVKLAPTGSIADERSWAVARPDDEWPAISFEVRESQEAIELETEQMRVRVELAPCRIHCFDQEGRAFARDAAMGMGWRDGGAAAWKRIDPDEHYYGFGERTGLLAREAEQRTN